MDMFTTVTVVVNRGNMDMFTTVTAVVNGVIWTCLRQ